MNASVFSGRFNNMFRILFLINITVSLSISMFDTFLPLHLFICGFNGYMLSITLSAYAATKVFAGPLIGRFADRADMKISLIISIAVLLLAAAIYSAHMTLASVITARILQGVSAALFRPVVYMYLGGMADDSGRASYMGTFDMSFYIAAGAGPVIGGIVKDYYGFGGITLLMAALCLVALIMASRISAVSCKSGVEENICGRDYTSASSLYALYLFIAGRACSVSMSCAFLPVIMTGNQNYSNTSSGAVMAVSTVCMVLFLRPAGRLADKFSYPGLIIFGGVCVSTLYFAVPHVKNLSGYMLVFAVIGATSILSQPAASSILVTEGRKNGLCSSVSLFNSCMNAGFAAGPAIGAAIMSKSSAEAVFSAAGILSLVSVACFAAVWRLTHGVAGVATGIRSDNLSASYTLLKRRY